jgi:hypothetical protein
MVETCSRTARLCTGGAGVLAQTSCAVCTGGGIKSRLLQTARERLVLIVVYYEPVSCDDYEALARG